MRLVVLCLLSSCLALACGCTTGPRPQKGGTQTVSLGGSAGATTAAMAAPENPQTPSVQTVERTIEREFAPAGAAGNAQRPTLNAERSSEAHAGGMLATHYPLLATERVTERATTQLGASQDLAKILREWGSIQKLRGLLIAVALLFAARVAWRREWPVIAVACVVGAIFSVVVAWWLGLLVPVLGLAIFAAYHAARSAAVPLPKP